MINAAVIHINKGKIGQYSFPAIPTIGNFLNMSDGNIYNISKVIWINLDDKFYPEIYVH